MSYPQFGYTYPSASQLLVSTQGSTPCCDASRPVVTDPLTGQTVCSCQYDSRPLSYPRLSTANLPPGAAAVYSAPYGDQAYPSISIEPSSLYNPLSNPYGLKDGSADMAAWQGLAPSSGYYPYDPTLAAYAGYGSYDLNGARRKNATRETTSTLKAWLSEHKKNPYPTKGEKIMLAIITKMTLTQVSTWFANARRRLKKDNKMTWEPKNKNGEDDDDDGSATDDEADVKKSSDDGGRSTPSKGTDKLDDDFTDSEKGCSKSPCLTSRDSEEELDDIKMSPSALIPPSCARLPTLSRSGNGVTSVTKPKIWSLADTATCKTPPPAVGSFPSSVQPWVPSVGAFQVPAPSLAPSLHSVGPNSSNGLHPSGLIYGSLCSSGRPGGVPYSDLHTDTPPQTPPNLKLPNLISASVSGGQEIPMSLANTYASHRTVISAAMASRLQASHGESRDVTTSSISGSQTLTAAGSQLHNGSSEMAATAFKPVFKRENPWT